MNDDRDEGEVLFLGFDSLVPAAAVAQRAVEATRRLLLDQAHSPRQASAAVTVERLADKSSIGSRTSLAISASADRAQRRYVFRTGLVASVGLVACVVAYFLATRQDRAETDTTISVSGPMRQPATPSQTPKALPAVAGGNVMLAPWAVPRLHAVSADWASILIANGGKEPVRLGSVTREGGGVLHVWDWSKGTLSRVLPDVEFWGTETVALSPDGKQLVWARGDILDLHTGEKSRINLMDEDVEVEDGTYSRICDMRFSPDGGRIALHVMNLEREKGIPGSRILSDVIRVVEFPSGRQFCEFPTGGDYVLRIGFSADGGQIAAADSQRQILLRDATTGNVRQRYAPVLTSQVMGIAIAPNAKYVAAMQREPGDLFLWNADGSQLAHHVNREALEKLRAVHPHYGVIRFSPDGRYLAASYDRRILVVDAATGDVISALAAESATNIQWSADGNYLTLVTPVRTGEPTLEGRDDKYPEVDTWDWRTHELVDHRGE